MARSRRAAVVFSVSTTVASSTAGLAGLAGRREVDRGVVLVGFLAVVGRDLVRVALLPAGLALGELLVELAGVEQDERGQLDRAGGGVDPAAIALLDQQRQQPAMVEVGVGQQDRIELARVERERDPVADRLVRAALEHPAVDEDPRPVGVEQELGPGDGRGATEEVDVHARMVTAAAGGRVSRGRMAWRPSNGRQSGMSTSASTATARKSRLR